MIVSSNRSWIDEKCFNETELGLMTVLRVAFR